MLTGPNNVWFCSRVTVIGGFVGKVDLLSLATQSFELLIYKINYVIFNF